MIGYVLILFFAASSLFLYQLDLSAHYETFVSGIQGHGRLRDFLKFYTIGQIARDHGPIYDWATQLSYMHRLLGTSNFDDPARAEYTPFFCVAVIPLTLLSLPHACVGFVLLCLALGLVALCVILRQRNFKIFECFAFCALVLSSLACFQNFQVGQLALLMVAFVAAYFTFCQQKNEIAAGFLLGLSTIKPQYTLILAAMPLATGRWKTLTSAFISAVVMVCIAMLVLGPTTVINYPHFLAEVDGHLSEHIKDANIIMISLRGWSATFLADTASISLFGALSYIAGSVLAFIVWLKAARLGPHTYPCAFAVTVCLSLLFSPHTMLYDFVLMGVAWAYSIKPIFQQSAKKMSTVESIWYLSFVLYPGLSWVEVLAGLNWAGVSTVHRCFLVFLLLTSYCLFNQVCARPSSADGTPSAEHAPDALGSTS